MLRALALAAALLLSLDARAAAPASEAAKAEQQKKEEAKKKEAGPPPNSPQAKLEALRKKREEEAAKESKRPPKKPADSPQVAAMKRARAQLVYVADACQNPAKCDKELRDDAVQRFKSACRECDSVDRCETEQSAILSGNVPRGSDICAPKP